MTQRWLVPAVSAAILFAAAPAATSAQGAGARSFDPAAFFLGRTVSSGRLKKIMSRAQATRAVGQGRIEGDTLVLDQTVTIEREPVRTRQWRLRPAGPGRWSGTISDARGPVSARAAGPVLTVVYTSLDGIGVVQTVTLAPDGRSARNRMKFRKFGLTVATVEETVVKD